MAEAKWRHFNEQDRVYIESNLKTGTSVKQLAGFLGKTQSSVYREIHRNAWNGLYEAGRAHVLSVERKSKANSHPVYGKAEWDAVAARVASGWSPEQCSGRARLEGVSMPSKSRIHEALASGWLGVSRMRRGKRRRVEKSRSDANKRHFRDSPEVLRDGESFGHWQGDCMEGVRSEKSAVAAFVEQSTLFVRARFLPEKDATSFREAAMGELQGHKVETILLDNGRECSCWPMIERRLKAEVWFCSPGKPWQKGRVENLMGLFRDWFPKRNPLGDRREAEKKLEQAVDALNGRPRKKLGWLTPKEAYERMRLFRIS